MKMKSNFFGVTAKLAIAILAVGTMFTSCYDSENGDVSKPYKAPDAVYTFVVTVSNGITGAPVSNATVTAGSTACASVGNGVYQAVVTNDQTGTKMPATMTVSVAATSEYEKAEATVNIATIENGQAITCYANIIVNPTGYVPEGLKVETSSNLTSETGSFTGDKTLEGENVEYVENMDIINSSDDPMQVTKNIKVFIGAKYLQQPAETKAIDVIAELKKYIESVEGTVGTDFSTEVRPYSFLLPAKSALQKISVQYMYDDKTFNFTYNGVSYVAKTRRVVSVIFSNTPVLTEMYHGHGHGHGHGGDLNAGGGIFE
ncbi:DUF3869 domain-containing protein [Bacteroides oleiciplenus]|uniref:DUF3869 domain-containing protein n=2 Tax=Bacteroides oleiciplenus TaxID=626931 RepID=A0A3E5BEY0_9BACE|nr:DUF3869 domain-containing protein [Bacteroides oleiciplenus]RGN35979.1 DUF3869 domain-containing protein [Bacteroides oleiciplenus]